MTQSVCNVFMHISKGCGGSSPLRRVYDRGWSNESPSNHTTAHQSEYIELRNDQAVIPGDERGIGRKEENLNKENEKEKRGEETKGLYKRVNQPPLNSSKLITINQALFFNLARPRLIQRVFLTLILSLAIVLASHAIRTPGKTKGKRNPNFRCLLIHWNNIRSVLLSIVNLHP